MTETQPAPYSARVLAGDIFTATVVGLSVAAPVTIIDYSIMMKVSGISPSIRHGLKEGFSTLLTRPHHFFLRNPHNQYALIYRVVATVYILTYLTSDITKNLMESLGYTNNEVNWARGIVTGINNTLLTMWKDSFILRRLPAAGHSGNANFVPMASRLGFCVRDIITCIAAFTLVPMFAAYLNERQSENNNALMSNASVSAITVPASMQFATTVLHIACIRYQRTYPNPSLHDITSSIRKDYLGSVAARIGRIIPAFGIGGIGNTKLLETTTQWAHDLDRKKRIA